VSTELFSAGSGVDNGPVVTVVLPTRNGAVTLGDALDSVLGQTYARLECVVIDDGSTDSTPERLAGVAAADPRVRVIRHDGSLGLQRALNRGLAEARGALVARIDDDDVWTRREKVADQVRAFGADPALQVIGTGAWMIDPARPGGYERRSPCADAAIRQVMLAWNPFVHSSVMFRRDGALAAGGYDERLHHSEDHDLWLKLGRMGTLANLEDVSVRYRLSASVSTRARRWRASREAFLLVRRHGRFYPGTARALLTAVGRFSLHALPVSQSQRSAWRRDRGR
jgi:glycosyltransferase involved in cell wall biosynthesis